MKDIIRRPGAVRICGLDIEKSAELEKMAQVGVGLNARLLGADNLAHVFLYFVVVGLNNRLHHILVGERSQHRYRLVCSSFSRHCLVVNDNLGMKNLLLDALPKLSDTAPTNIPCVSVDILLAGIRASS